MQAHVCRHNALLTCDHSSRQMLLVVAVCAFIASVDRDWQHGWLHNATHRPCNWYWSHLQICWISIYAK